MKKEYDFYKGVRGKFFKKNAELNIKIYSNNDSAAAEKSLVKAHPAVTDHSVTEQPRFKFRFMSKFKCKYRN